MATPPRSVSIARTGDHRPLVAATRRNEEPRHHAHPCPHAQPAGPPPHPPDRPQPRGERGKGEARSGGCETPAKEGQNLIHVHVRQTGRPESVPRVPPMYDGLCPPSPTFTPSPPPPSPRREARDAGEGRATHNSTHMYGRRRIPGECPCAAHVCGGLPSFTRVHNPQPTSTARRRKGEARSGGCETPAKEEQRSPKRSYMVGRRVAPEASPCAAHVRRRSPSFPRVPSLPSLPPSLPPSLSPSQPSLAVSLR